MDKYYRAKKSYGKLIQINRRTGLPTGAVKNNTASDPDYIAPHEDFGSCPPYKLYWVLKKNSFSCTVQQVGSVVINTGESTSILQQRKTLLVEPFTDKFTGLEKPNIESDPDYIDVKQKTQRECRKSVVKWRGKKSTSYCIKEGTDNTGYLAYLTLEQYIEGSEKLTGNEKLNVNTDPDYIAPVYNTGVCPIFRPTGWRVKESSVFCVQADLTN